MEVPRRQRPVQGHRRPGARGDAGSRTSATSRSASSVRSPSTCPSSSRPGGIADIEVTDIVEATNREANELKAEGADIVVLLVHEGAATTALASATDPASDFGKIVNGVNANVDAIISGHTHLAYNHRIPVPAWQASGSHGDPSPGGLVGSVRLQPQPAATSGSTPTAGELKGISQSIVPLQSGDATWTAELPGRPRGHRRSSTAANDEGRGARCRTAGQDQRALQPGSHQHQRREPRRRVDAGQPGGRGPALGDRRPPWAARRSPS